MWESSPSYSHKDKEYLFNKLSLKRYFVLEESGGRVGLRRTDCSGAVCELIGEWVGEWKKK